MSEDKVTVGNIAFGPCGAPKIGPGKMIPLPAPIETINKCYAALSALGDPVVVAENIGELVTVANEIAHAYWDIDQDGPDSPCVKLLAEKMKALTDLLWKLKDRPNGDTNG